ncbi:hypothetical protein Tco_0439078 [Tanacetum coccineum]
MVEAIEPKTIQKAVLISDTLTDEAVRNRSIKKVEKRGNVGEPSKDKNVIMEYLVKDSKRRPFWSLNEELLFEDQYAVSIGSYNVSVDFALPTDQQRMIA